MNRAETFHKKYNKEYLDILGCFYCAESTSYLYLPIVCHELNPCRYKLIEWRKRVGSWFSFYHVCNYCYISFSIFVWLWWFQVPRKTKYQLRNWRNKEGLVLNSNIAERLQHDKWAKHTFSHWRLANRVAAAICATETDHVSRRTIKLQFMLLI